MEHASKWLRHLPQLDAWLKHDAFKPHLESLDTQQLSGILRNVIQNKRKTLIEGEYEPESEEALLIEMMAESLSAIESYCNTFYKPLINATGIVLHTNLGRAPLAESAIEAMTNCAKGYFNLEYDLKTGRRGLRSAGIGQLLNTLTGAEAAIVVNNNAAAVLLVLSALVSGKEAIISRGELVEVGGGFRIPEVMVSSGAKLIEVGTTNKTSLKDYERQIHESTSAIVKVHTSNFKIMGFTSQPSRAELISLAHQRELYYIEDLGSGQLIRMRDTILDTEPSVSEILTAGADVLTFSGDKLLGGPQCGIIVGKKDLLEKIESHPLMRAVRADKLTLAALEATLKLYLNEETLLDIPAVRMLTTRGAVLGVKAQAILDDIEAELGLNPLDQTNQVFKLSLGSGTSEAGGGSLPTEKLQTTTIDIHGQGLDLIKLQERLRRQTKPIICKIEDGAIKIDPRTILIDDREDLVMGIVSAIHSHRRMP